MNIPKLKKKAFDITLDVYPYTIFVVFIDLGLLRNCLLTYKYKISDTEINDIIESFKVNSNCAARTLSLTNGNQVVFFPHKSFILNSYTVNTITHEVLHITHNIMDRIGLKLNFKSDEAFCYLNGYINQKIFEQL